MALDVACPSCGSRIDPNSRFCTLCGRANPESAATLVVGGQPAPAATPAAGATQPTRDALFQLLVKTTVGEYDIACELGRGGMARVFLAHDLGLDRDVAIKVMHPALVHGDGMVERFKREARTAASVSHPNIIPIYHVRETEDLLYFVMKYVRGRSLESIIQEGGPMPIKMIENIVSQVGEALQYAHRKNIVHRDIKPGNIMLDDDGLAVVTDFGIVKVSEADGLTMTGSTIGTPYYMSPEQCSALPVTGASDQYSLGIVAYEMLTGKPPFPGPTVMEVMRAHFFDAPVSIRQVRPDCPPHLERAVMRMLAKEPHARWPDIHEAVVHIGAPQLEENDPVRSQMIELARSGDAFRRFARASVPVSPVPLGKAEKKKPERSRRSYHLVWATLIVLAIAATGVLLWSKRPGQGAPAQSLTGDSGVVRPEQGTPRISPQDSVAPAGDSSSIRSLAADSTAQGRVEPKPFSIPSRPPDRGQTARRNPAAPSRVDTIVLRDTTRTLVSDSARTIPSVPIATTGTIIVRSTNRDAWLYINDEPIVAAFGTRTIQVGVGSLKIEMRAEGCDPSVVTRTMTPGGSIRVGTLNPICATSDSVSDRISRDSP